MLKAICASATFTAILRQRASRALLLGWYLNVLAVQLRADLCGNL